MPSTYKLLFPRSSRNPGGISSSVVPSSTIITAFGLCAVGHHGTCALKLDCGSSCKLYQFHFADTDGLTVLNLPTCTDLNFSIISSAGRMAKYVASTYYQRNSRHHGAA